MVYYNQSYPCPNVYECWKRLWQYPWRRVTFYTNENNLTVHRCQSLLDARLQDEYGRRLIAASFERRGVTVALASGSIHISSTSANQKDFNQALQLVTGILARA